MAKDQDINEPSGPAPGDEVPYEERFLSSEKQYPTKEARKKALDEAKLPHVPPFITEPSPKPDWQPVPEPVTTPQITTVGHLEAKGGARRFNRLVTSPEETQRANQERSQELVENIAERYKQKAFKVPQEAIDYIPPSQTPPTPRPFTPAPQSPPQVPTVQEQKGGIGNFFRRLFRR